jgi:hypothetical protein
MQVSENLIPLLERLGISGEYYYNTPPESAKDEHGHPVYPLGNANEVPVLVFDGLTTWRTVPLPFDADAGGLIARGVARSPDYGPTTPRVGASGKFPRPSAPANPMPHWRTVELARKIADHYGIDSSALPPPPERRRL